MLLRVPPLSVALLKKSKLAHRARFLNRRADLALACKQRFHGNFAVSIMKVNDVFEQEQVGSFPSDVRAKEFVRAFFI